MKKKYTYLTEKAKEKLKLELDLLEIRAYCQLENQEFIFHEQKFKNTDEFHLGSEDAYYKMGIQTLEDILEYWDEDHSVKNKSKNHKSKLNHYQKKTYWHKNKLLAAIKQCAPWWSYSECSNDNGEVYYQRSYQCNKEIRKILCKPIRRKLNNCINEDYDICAMRGMSWKKIYNYKWDIW